MRRLFWLFVIALLIAGWWYVRRRHQFFPNLSSAFTILVIGLDEGNRADALLLTYIHPKAGLQFLVIPRDTYCTKGRKINGLYKRLGAKKFTELVSQIVAHPIEGYCVFDLKALPGFLNRTFPNGLVVLVPYRLRYSDKAAGFSYDIPAGFQRLDGSQLVFYLRDRYSDPQRRGEAARVERWKLFLEAALAELRKPQNIVRLPKIAADACRTFKINLGVKEIFLILKAVVQANSFSVSYLPGKPFRLGGIWFVQLDKESARRQARLRKLGITVPKDLRVWVLNGTAEPNLARLTAKRIQRKVGVYCSVGNALSAFERVTTVEYTQDVLAPLAHEIAKEVKARRVIRVKNPDGFVKPTIIVTLGSDRARELLSEVNSL